MNGPGSGKSLLPFVAWIAGRSHDGRAAMLTEVHEEAWLLWRILRAIEELDSRRENPRESFMRILLALTLAASRIHSLGDCASDGRKVNDR